MTRSELEELEEWISWAEEETRRKQRSPRIATAKRLMVRMLSELRDHEEWKARISQDHDAYDQGVRDRTTKFVEVLEALRDDQRRKKNTALEMARTALTTKVGDGDPAKYHRMAECLRSGEEFCGVLLRMIEEGLL